MFSLGFVWTFIFVHSMMVWSLPIEWEGKPLEVIGYIASLPVTDPIQTHFLFELKKVKLDKQIIQNNALIKISWRQPAGQHQIKVGDKWQFNVRLKRIHGTQNPGGFDYEAWALQKRLLATGYILSNKNNQFISHSWRYNLIDQFRQMLYQRIQTYLPNSKTAPWLMALMLGERNNISEKDWQVLRNTGTNHLMAIAGLHIAVIFGMTHLITAWIWRRIPFLLLRFPAQYAAAYAALIIAIFYSALAGFSIPTQRACYMLTIFILMLLKKRIVNSWHVWSTSLGIMLLNNPLIVLTESFWLSFGTIALIIYGMGGRLKPRGWWWKWGRVQWVISLGLVPFTLFLFQQSSMISFIANSIAIPWVEFLILPFCFLSTVFVLLVPSVSMWLIFIADKSCYGLWVLLSWISQLPFSSWHQVIPNAVILIQTLCGCLLLLLPNGFPGRWLGIFWILPLLVYQPSKPALGDYWLTLLDVGQGLSAVIQTKTHVLVYDAGPKFQGNVDMGESVVLPYLYTQNTRQIDMLVISHGDNDHIGGVAALLNSLSIQSVKTSVPQKLLLFNQRFHFNVDYCLAGETWQWDQVTFSFLYPTSKMLSLGNNSSCILQISNGSQTILLTGDIEKLAEKKLLMTTIPLSADILIAPHHGSRTSGLKEFITAVHPSFVLYAIGYRNRYHFPHQTIVKSYEELKSTQLDTVSAGAIQFKLERDKTISQPALYRLTHKKYWMV